MGSRSVDGAAATLMDAKEHGRLNTELKNNINNKKHENICYYHCICIPVF